MAITASVMRRFSRLSRLWDVPGRDRRYVCCPGGTSDSPLTGESPTAPSSSATARILIPSPSLIAILNTTPLTYCFDQLPVHVFSDRTQMGRAAAEAVIASLREQLTRQENVRIVFAAAPSQDDFLAALSKQTLDWSRVVGFQMDEYLGLPVDHPQRFANYLREHFYDRVPIRTVHTMQTGADDLEAEIMRYTALMTEAPMDFVCLGIGENGHLAFNDPPVADFEDPVPLKVVELDAVCRQQQVSDGCFARLADVPERALTMTMPALMAGHQLSVVVPGTQKARAVHEALLGSVTTACPASILRRHSRASLFVDKDAFYLTMQASHPA